MDQSHREGRAGSETRSRRQVAVVMNFESLIIAPGPCKNGTDGGVLDLFDAAHIFNYRIDDAVFVLEERRKVPAADMAIFIDRGRQHHPTMLLIPSWIVGAAAE